MSDTARRFGRRLRAMRVARQLSQFELATRAGLSENAISAFERAERFPRSSTIDALAKAMETDVDALLVEVLRSGTADGAELEVETVVSAESGALWSLAKLLRDRPEPQVRLVYEVAERILQDLPVDS